MCLTEELGYSEMRGRALTGFLTEVSLPEIDVSMSQRTALDSLSGET